MRALGGVDIDTMNIKSSKVMSPASTGWLSVLLPIVAGLIHVRVFYLSVFHCILPAHDTAATSAMSTEAFLTVNYEVDATIFAAYAADLLCCLLGVRPFSRVRNARDIVGHHLPTILLALPLAAPLWMNLRSVERTALGNLDANGGDECRTAYITAYLLSTGYAYSSSLNEVVMCFQRAEMSLQGTVEFNDIKSMRNRFFTSDAAIYLELAYKVLYFWGISILGCKNCCSIDVAMFKYLGNIMAGEGGGSFFAKAWIVYTSPV